MEYYGKKVININTNEEGIIINEKDEYITIFWNNQYNQIVRKDVALGFIKEITNHSL